LIELFHPSSGTYYEFEGQGYIQFLRNANGKTDTTKPSGNKKRKQKSEKTDNPRENTRN
ncbi:nicotinic acid mononucleotide adenyltransferase, partial [Flavobacteriaceae bacterium PRS1]